MQELAKAIEAVEQGEEPQLLRGAAKRWAEYSLDTYKDDLLHRALAISEALVQFMNEMEASSRAVVRREDAVHNFVGEGDSH